MNKDHTETEDMKFIWGVKSYDDLTDSEPNFTTFNDIELIYIQQPTKLKLRSLETSLVE